MGEDEVYRPTHDSDSDTDNGHELDSSLEEIRIKETQNSQSSKSIPRKTFKMKKVSPKAMAMAMAFKKRQQGFQLASSPILKNGSSLQQSNEFAVESSSKNDTHFENGKFSFLNIYIVGIEKSRRGPTMCYKVHGRSVEERLEITVNEHGQPIGPDDATCNEFISFLGTIARKAHILPLTIPNWPILRKEKHDELWGYVTKKDRKTTQDPSPIQMLIATRKEKLTKRKPGDLRDKMIVRLNSEKDVDTVISNIVGSDNKKKCRFNLHGRGVSSTQLKQKDIMKKVEEKHAKEVEAIQKDYEDKRQQDRRDIANGLRSFFFQFQQQNPHMSFDLSMFGSLLLDGQTEKDTNPVGLLQLRSSSSTSKEMNKDVEGEEEDDDSN
ncbi:N-acetylglucosaminyldiphosphoundecaprenol N-acetyl-beta-D-mannosaminyltransferase [Bienertia sinuspersici]